MCVSAMLKDRNWPTLEERRYQSRLAMMFTIHRNLVDIREDQHLSPSSSTTKGHSYRFKIPQTKSSVYTMSFFPQTTRDWNNLQKNPAVYSSLETFKAVLRDALLNVTLPYHCFNQHCQYLHLPSCLVTLLQLIYITHTSFCSGNWISTHIERKKNGNKYHSTVAHTSVVPIAHNFFFKKGKFGQLVDGEF